MSWNQRITHSRQAKKLFEQTGWLKAELERLRTDMVREDRPAAAGKNGWKGSLLAETRSAPRFLMGELDRAFERGIPGDANSLCRQKFQKVQERQAAEFEDSLVKAGLERKPDGSIGPKVHPVRRAIVRNTKHNYGNNTRRGSGKTRSRPWVCLDWL